MVDKFLVVFTVRAWRAFPRVWVVVSADRCLIVFFRVLNSLTLLVCNVGIVDRTLRGVTKSRLHRVLKTVAAGQFAKVLANAFVAYTIRDSSTAAIVAISFIGTNLLALTRTVSIVVNTGVNAAFAT